MHGKTNVRSHMSKLVKVNIVTETYWLPRKRHSLRMYDPKSRYPWTRKAGGYEYEV